LFKYGFFNVQHGNHVATVVTYEETGNVNVQRIPALFTSTILGAGLGDTNFDGAYSPPDINIFRDVLISNNTAFNSAADLDGNGLVDRADLLLLGNRLTEVNADQATRDAYNALLGEANATRIGDFVWRDLNNNGIQEAGEPGLADVHVRLLDAATLGIVASTLTSASGFSSFAALIPGQYRIEFELPPGGFAFAPAGQGIDVGLDSDADPLTGQTLAIDLAFGQAVESIDAGFYLPGVGHPWQNPRLRFDVDDDSRVLPLDALLILTALNSGRSSILAIPPTTGESPPPFFDVSGDDRLTPLDALEIIIYLNAGLGGEAEPQTAPPAIDHQDRRFAMTSEHAAWLAFGPHPLARRNLASEIDACLADWEQW
jgi:hypothetical protein